jgi:hypothetical protein
MKWIIPILTLCLIPVGCSKESTSQPGGDEPPVYQLAGSVTLNGNNITQYTDVVPTFWVRNETTGQAVETAKASYEAATGTYGFTGLPDGPIGISAEYHVTGSAPTKPGNYRSWTTLDLSTLTAPEAADFALKAVEIIHLTDPFDNDHEAVLNTYPAHASPVNFAWEPVEGAVRYVVEVAEYQNDPYSLIDQVILDENVTGTSKSCELATSAEGTHYEFSLTAYNDQDEMVGYYMSTYGGGYGWDYRFTVQPFQLAGTITFNGSRISQYTDVAPTFWVRDETTGQTVETAKATYDAASGSYGFTGLPMGPIGISVEYHITGSAPTKPGNYRAWTTLDLSLLTTPEATDFALKTYEIMHLTDPFDNDQEAVLNTYPAHASPVTFTWEPVEGAVRYAVTVAEYQNDPYGLIGQVVDDESISGTSKTCELATSAEGTHYEFGLTAYNDQDEMVGYYMTTYGGGYGWDYRFTVQ